MIDFFLAMMAAGVNSADGSTGGSSDVAVVDPPAIVAPEVVAEATPTAPQTDQLAPLAPADTNSSVVMGSGVIVGQGVLLEGVATTPTAQAPIAQAPAVATPTPAAPQPPGMNMSVVPAGLVADDQTPTGKFTTAGEVKPILNATKGNWVAVREYDGKDLLYVTHLWSWRCGLHAMAISINDEPMQNWPLPECHMKYTTPSAILEDDGLPYLSFKLGGVQTIDIQIVYDDLSMDAVRFERGNVLIP
ncbi:MAG: hypothetical protein WA790_16225 [Sulfitobacter sp.]